MADRIREATGIEAELVPGDRGEFSVWVGDVVVAKKGLLGFPGEDAVVEKVKAALDKGG